MGIGIAKASSLAKSLNVGARSSAPKLGGQTPKLGHAGSSFAESLIQQVIAGTSPSEIIRHLKLEASEFDIERQASQVSPKGRPLEPGMIQAGMHIGIRGPVHNGYHTVDTVANGMITMKCEDGRSVTMPMSDLENHEVVHALANV